jgi:hypothetical protein
VSPSSRDWWLVTPSCRAVPAQDGATSFALLEALQVPRPTCNGAPAPPSLAAGVEAVGAVPGARPRDAVDQVVVPGLGADVPNLERRNVQSRIGHLVGGLTDRWSQQPLWAGVALDRDARRCPGKPNGEEQRELPRCRAWPGIQRGREPMVGDGFRVQGQVGGLLGVGPTVGCTCGAVPSGMATGLREPSHLDTAVSRIVRMASRRLTSCQPSAHFILTGARKSRHILASRWPADLAQA